MCHVLGERELERGTDSCTRPLMSSASGPVVPANRTKADNRALWAWRKQRVRNHFLPWDPGSLGFFSEGPCLEKRCSFSAWVQGACGVERNRLLQARSWETQGLVPALPLTYCVTLVSVRTSWSPGPFLCDEASPHLLGLVGS